MSPELDREIEKYLSKKNPYFNNFSKELQQYLEITYPNLPTIRSRWYMIQQNIKEIPTCQYKDCKQQCLWNEREKKFNSGCCIDHTKRITSLKNYGTEHPNQSKKQQEKVKKSMQNKYGVDYITQTAIHKDNVKSTVKRKYGVDTILKAKEIRKKIKATNLDRYGSEEILLNATIREKIRLTMLKKYGVEHSLASVKIRNKVNKTNLEKYGSIFPMRNNELQQKRLETMMDTYGAYSHLSDLENLKKFREKILTTYYTKKLLTNEKVIPRFSMQEYTGTINENNRAISYEWECKKCNFIFNDFLAAGHLPSCPQCYPRDWIRSKSEKEIFESIEITEKEHSNRNIIGKELDIYLPTLKLAIEYNGVYWHSEQKGKDKYYHFNKTLLCENNGIKLLHIFDFEWKHKKSIINGLINKYLNKSKVVELKDVSIEKITKKTFNTFLELYSLHNPDNFSKFLYGCYFDNTLIAVFNFSKLQHNKAIELRKFVEKPGYVITSEILKSVLTLIEEDIYYYADRRFYSYIDKDFFENIGFSLEGVTEPAEYYFHNNQLITSSSIYQNIYNYIKKEEYNTQLTMKENLELCGFLTVWDSGRLVYKKLKNKNL